MNKNRFDSLDGHIDLLGWIFIVSNIFVLFIMTFVMMILFGVGLFSGEAEAFGVMVMIMMIVGMMMLVFAVPGILAGWGLLKRKSWARILALVIGILNIMSFPIGTAVGMYTVYVLLLREGSDTYFNNLKAA